MEGTFEYYKQKYNELSLLPKQITDAIANKERIMFNGEKKQIWKAKYDIKRNLMSLQMYINGLTNIDMGGSDVTNILEVKKKLISGIFDLRIELETCLPVKHVLNSRKRKFIDHCNECLSYIGCPVLGLSDNEMSRTRKQTKTFGKRSIDLQEKLQNDNKQDKALFVDHGGWTSNFFLDDVGDTTIEREKWEFIKTLPSSNINENYKDKKEEAEENVREFFRTSTTILNTRVMNISRGVKTSKMFDNFITTKVDWMPSSVNNYLTTDPEGYFDVLQEARHGKLFGWPATWASISNSAKQR